MRVRALLTTLVWMLAVSAAAAQSGGIRVMVYDAAAKSPIPGATATLKNSMQLVATTTATANDSGVVEFPVLRPGAGYSVEIYAKGFARQEMVNLRVKINEVTPVVFTLPREITERVRIVEKREKVDLDKASVSTKFGEDFIQDLPVMGRFYQNVLTLAAGVLDADGDGNPNVHGARSRDFKTQVNGVSNQDPLTGEWMSLINPDSIEEIEVITAGAGAEFGRAQGGFANIIQKQGSNDFEGVLNYLLRSSKLDGDATVSSPGVQTPEYSTHRPSFQLSGPIVRDRLWYRLSHEWIHREDPINIVGATIVSTTRREIHADQLTWQVSPRNKLAFQYQEDPLSIDNWGVSSLRPAESSMRVESGGPQYLISWTAPYSAKLLVDSLVSYQNSHQNILPATSGVPNSCIKSFTDEQTGRSGLPFLEKAECTDLTTGRVSGSFATTWKDERQRLTVKSLATAYGGKAWGMNHQFKVGFSVENERYFRYLQRLPSLSFYIVRQNSGQGSPSLGEVAYVAATVSVPQETRGRATSTNWGVFVEDQVKPTQNLTITLGLRLDQEGIDSTGFLPIDPSAESRRFRRKIAASESTEWGSIAPTIFTSYEGIHNFVEQLAANLGLPTYVIERALSPKSIQSQFWYRSRPPGDVNIVNTNFAPRLSAAWDPWSDGKTKFALTAGRYFDKIFLAIPLIELEPVTTTVQLSALKRGAIWEVQPLGQAYKINPAISTRVVDRGLRTPFQDELTLSVERELWAETSLKATFVYRKFVSQFQDVDINHYAYDYGRCRTAKSPNPLDFGGDPAHPKGDGQLDDCIGDFEFPPGLPSGGGGPTDPAVLYQVPDGYLDTYTYNPGWGGIYLVGNFNTATYQGLVLELVRRQYRNWQMEASYTYSKAVGDAEDFDSYLGNDRTTLDDERGFLSYDQRHVVKINATTITPWGFRMGAAVNWQSGLPYSLLAEKPTYDALPPQYQGLGIPDERSRLRYVTRQRNDQRNRSFWNFDLKADKEMNLRGGVNLQLSAEIFNLLNDKTYTIFNPYFGYGAQINGYNDAYVRIGRVYQLSARLSF